MNIDDRLRAIIGGFDFPGTLAACEAINTGHINATYKLRFALPGGDARDYVLQRINTYVFKKPDEVMENIQLVTEHLSRAMAARGIDPENRVLRLAPAKGGGAMIEDGEGGYWRAYDFITRAHAVDRVEGPDQFREIGRAFGAFQAMLADFPIERLHDTIPNFHDTRKRLGDFERSVRSDPLGRAASVPEEIEAVRSRGEAMCCIVDMIESGDIPLRVTHNDTKINNVMLDVDTGEALCVIDLDTVMAGSALYDFGDAIRYGACTAAEDETDLSKVTLDIDLFRGFTEGFVSQTANGLTRTELENLPLGALVMTYENGLRFLADYLDGDVYFHVDWPEHNLARARCQLKLLSEMEKRRDGMDAITRQLIDKYTGG